MTDLTAPRTPALPRRAALALAALLVVVELGAIGLIYKHAIAFTCLANWPRWACAGPSGALVACYTLLAALALFFLLRPAPLARLVAEAGHSLRPLMLNLAGFAIAMIPIALLAEGAGTRVLWPTLTLWSVGFALLGTGLALFLAPLPRWRALLSESGGALALVVFAGLAAPSLATLIRPLWRLDTIADWTFSAVAWLTAALGYTVIARPEDKIIGAGDFYISVAPVCSGIEGIALVTVFVTLYLSLFRAELRFPRAFLLYPVGIAVSALLNVVRIVALLVIGIEGRPELAVGGFHSHAGWLMFTLVALGIVLAARSVPALQRAPAAAGGPAAAGTPPLPLLRDPAAARLLPFAIFMFSALLAQALSEAPGLIYPLRALAMAAALALFWPIYRRLAWRLDPLAIGAGAAIGLMWVLVPYPVEDPTPAYAGLSGALLVGWMLVRGLGTVLLVPLIEELFFRDYLEGKLRGLGGPIVAALITAALFAALHDRWAEAFVAGLMFSWVMQRGGRVTDAVLAHAMANLIVFAVALATGQMHII